MADAKQGPLYFHASRNENFRKNYDKIFRKKAKAVKNQPVQTTPDKLTADTT